MMRCEGTRFPENGALLACRSIVQVIARGRALLLRLAKPDQSRSSGVSERTFLHGTILGVDRLLRRT